MWSTSGYRILRSISPSHPPGTKTGQTSLPRLSGKAGIVVEALIEVGRRQELVSQPEIAELSGSTQAWASRVFRELVREGALEVVGRGPAKEWRPKLDDLLRLWISDGGPSPAVTRMYLWTRTPSELLRAMGQIGKDGLPHAIGGVAAADLHEPTLTSVPLVNVWIPLSTPPEGIAAGLGAELVDSGANLLIWQAPGDPALRLAGPLDGWRSDAPEGFGPLSVVTPSRAAVEALQGTGRGPEVGENLRRRLVENAPGASDDA